MSWRWQWRHLLNLPRADFLVAAAAQASTTPENGVESRALESLACSPETWINTHAEYEAGIDRSTVTDALVAAHVAAAIESAERMDSTDGPVIAARVKPQFGAAALTAPQTTQHRTTASAATALLLASMEPTASGLLEDSETADGDADEQNGRERLKSTGGGSTTAHQTKGSASMLDVQKWLQTMVADQRGITSAEVDLNRPLEE